MKLGFHAPMTRLYVFVANEGNHLWYYLEDGEKVFIPDTALTGTIKGFEVVMAGKKFGEKEKADFEILGDRPYVLRSGIDTAFTKGMLMIIKSMSQTQLERPVTIELKPGAETGNVLLSARDSESLNFIRTGSWKGINWEELKNQALYRLPRIKRQNEQDPEQFVQQSQPLQAAEGLYPKHNQVTQKVRDILKLGKPQVIEILRGQFEGKSPDNLEPGMFALFLEEIVLNAYKTEFYGEEEILKKYRDLLINHNNDPVLAISKWDELQEEF